MAKGGSGGGRSEEMSHEHEVFVAVMAEWFYGSKPDQVTDDMADVLAEAVEYMMEHHGVLGRVGRHNTSVPGSEWLTSEAVMAALRRTMNEVEQSTRQNVGQRYHMRYEISRLSA